jgi:hypothetical protein
MVLRFGLSRACSALTTGLHVRPGEDDEQPNYVDHDPIRPYKRGEKTAPLPTYFICGKEVCASL